VFAFHCSLEYLLLITILNIFMTNNSKKMKFGSFTKVLFVLLSISAVLFFFSRFGDLVEIVLIASAVRFMLMPFMKYLEYEMELKRSVAAIIVLLGFTLSLSLVLYLVIPLLVEATKSAIAQSQTFSIDQMFLSSLSSVTESIRFIDKQQVMKQFHALLSTQITALQEIAKGIPGVIGNLAIVPFILYFFLTDGNTIYKSFIELVPNSYFEMVLNIMNQIQKKLIGYFHGLLIESIIVGILMMIGYYCINIQYALMIGILVGLCNFVPYFGVIIGTITSIMVSIIQYGDLHLLLPILGLTALVQLTDDFILRPMLFGKAMNIHPITVVVVLLAGKSASGFLGMLFAIPLYTIMKVVAIECYWGLNHYKITQ
jgi:predicted PurR-regulated permease PerM